MGFCMKHQYITRNIRGLYSCVLLALTILSISGCTNQTVPKVTPVNTISHQVSNSDNGKAPPALQANSSHLAQCTSELNALKQFNSEKYSHYKTELDNITRSGAQYLAVANGISQEINDLMQPRYQYAITSLCQSVRSELTASLVNQVNIR